MRARKRTTNTENYVALIVFLFGIIGILSAFWDDITADKKLALTLASLALFMLTERLASFVSSLKETETRDDIKDIIIDGVAGLRSELRSNSMVTAILRPSEVFERLSASKKRMIIVKDTTLRFDGEHTYARDTITYDLSHDWFKKCIDARCSWLDIMSQNIVTARARHIDYGINKALFVGQYRCRTLNLAAPMPNFIIVTFEDGEKEVYFGWDYDFSPNNLVMASSNIRIIEYFDRLFDKMFASGADIKQDLQNNTHQ